MYALDEIIIQSILDILTSHNQALLATIIRTEGTTPRGPGTQMLIMANGQTVGTIGGGTAESFILKKAAELLKLNNDIQASIHRLKINQETDPARLGVCGANLEVLIEPVQDPDFWQFVLDRLINGSEAVLATSLAAPFAKSVLDLNGYVLKGQPHQNLIPPPENLQEIYSSRQTKVFTNSEGLSWLAEPLLKTERLLILGAGHVAREVAAYAKPLDFQVTVIDDRAAFALPEFFPGVQAVICQDYVQGIKDYLPNDNTYVVISTWSHQTDADCLNELLNFPAKYIGMLGSTKKVAAIVRKMLDAGYTTQNVARLRAPIGLDINAQTPSEIAISILAEIISVRRAAQDLEHI